MNTRDEYYLSEKTYYDENMPKLTAIAADFNRAFLSSPYLSDALGQRMLRLSDSERDRLELAARRLDALKKLFESCKRIRTGEKKSGVGHGCFSFVR